MPVSDPAQLLQRIPELEALVADARIRKAVESGNPFKVYRALVWARLLRRLPEQREVLKALTRQRRLFARPLKGSPALGSINSVGFGFVGSSEADKSDGTYIALHAFVVLFAVPLVPLGSYIVKSEGSSGLSSQWRIYARVPMGMISWTLSRGFAAGLVLLIGAGAFNAVHRSRYQELTVLNGFDVPVQISFGDKKLTVPAQGRSMLELPMGKIEGEARTDAAGTIDRLSKDRNGSTGLAVWNIAGAAPLVKELVSYSSTPHAGGGTRDEVKCGMQFAELGSPDYAFVDPPKSISTKRSSGVEQRSHVYVVAATGRTGANVCLQYLMENDMHAAVLPLAETVGRVDNWPSGVGRLAAVAGLLTSPESALRVSKAARDAHPQDIDAQRMYQIAMLELGKDKEAHEEYDDAARAAPDSGDAQYLARVLYSGAAGLGPMEAVHTRFADNVHAMRSLCWRYMAHGNPLAVDRIWTSLKALSTEDAERVIGQEIQALVALNQTRRAAELLAQSSEDVERSAVASLVAGLLGEDREAPFAAFKDADPNTLDLQRVRAGLEPLSKPTERSTAVLAALALRTDPATALKLASQAHHVDLMYLGEGQWTLLYGEAARIGDKAALTRLEHVNHKDATTRALLARFARGEAVNLNDDDIDVESQAAAMLVRSRNPSLPAAERQALRENAQKLDLLHGVVSLAAKNWSA